MSGAAVATLVLATTVLVGGLLASIAITTWSSRGGRRDER